MLESPDRLIGTAFERQLKASLDVWPQLPVRSRDPSGLPISGTVPAHCARWLRKRPNTRQGEGYSTWRRRSREKAIANQAKRAHGRRMHNNCVGAKLSAKDRRV